MIYNFTRPSTILQRSRTLVPWCLGFALILGILGVYMGLIWSPADYQQGDVVRIMYVHVPASWGAMAVYTIMAISSAIALIKRIPLLHLITQAAAPVGLVLCLISLITGSIWGYPTWGTWWVWDARLTSMLLLAFLYSGYILVTHNDEYPEKSLSMGAFIAIIGWINVPIIKWSVEWWHTLHQPASIMRFAKPAIHWTMLFPLLTMAFAFAFFAITIFLMRLQYLLLHRHFLSNHFRQDRS